MSMAVARPNCFTQVPSRFTINSGIVGNPNMKPMSYPSNRRIVASLAIGDLLVFVAFIILGKIEHGIIQVEALFRTTLPFAATWFAVSPWLGAYRFSVVSSVRSTVWRVSAIWLVCGIITIGLRAWLTDRTFQLNFALVAIGVQAVLLLGWRVVFVTLVRRLLGSW